MIKVTEVQIRKPNKVTATDTLRLIKSNFKQVSSLADFYLNNLYLAKKS